VIGGSQNQRFVAFPARRALQLGEANPSVGGSAAYANVKVSKRQALREGYSMWEGPQCRDLLSFKF